MLSYWDISHLWKLCTHSPFFMDDHAVKHRTNLTWHICIRTVKRNIGIASTRNIRSATGCRICGGFTAWSSITNGECVYAETCTNILRYNTCMSSYPVDHSIGPVDQVRCKKPWSGRSKLPDVQPLWLNFRPLPVSSIAWHTCIIPLNVCTCLCFINIYSKTVYTPLDWSK